MTVRRSDLYLPMHNSTYQMGFQFGLFPRRLYQGHLRTTIGVFEVGNLRIACVPGEIEPHLAGRIQESRGAPSLVFALCDDELGYLMTAEDAVLPTFAYERTLTPCDDAGDRIMKAVTDLARGAAPPR
jgi:hypothetical protein